MNRIEIELVCPLAVFQLRTRIVGGRFARSFIFRTLHIHSVEACLVATYSAFVTADHPAANVEVALSFTIEFYVAFVLDGIELFVIIADYTGLYAVIVHGLVAWDTSTFAYYVDIFDDVRIARVYFIECFGIEQVELGQTVDDGNTFPTLCITAGMVHGTVLEFAQYVSAFHVVTVGEVVSATCREVYGVVRVTVHPFLKPASSLVYHACVETRFTVGVHIGDILIRLLIFIVGVIATVFYSAESGFIVTTVRIIDIESIVHEES